MNTDASNRLYSSTEGQEKICAKAPIRKGQRKPYFKASRKQIEQRIGAAGVLSFCGFAKARIHKIFRKRYGVEWRQTDRYLARARE